ncbi:MAG: PAS domain S-box protein [SAR202 cluster bacterium]|nr:PAS domain S-box protein [SAR202 cluster bacterium]
MEPRPQWKCCFSWRLSLPVHRVDFRRRSLLTNPHFPNLYVQSREPGDWLTTLWAKSPVGFFIVENGRFVLVNQSFLDCVGYPESEVLGKDSLMPVHPWDRAMVRRKNIRLLEGRDYGTYEYRCAHKSGRTVWALGSVTSVHMEGSRACLGYFMYITDMKRAEQQAQERNEELEAVLNIANVLAGAGDFFQKARAVLTEIKKLALADRAAYWIPDVRGQQLHLVATVGLDEAQAQTPSVLPTANSITGQALQGMQPVIENNYLERPDSQEHLMQLGIRSLAAFPVHHNGNVLAVVTIGSEERGRFDPRKIQVFGAVVAQIGMLIGNATLEAEAAG